MKSKLSSFKIFSLFAVLTLLLFLVSCSTSEEKKSVRAGEQPVNGAPLESSQPVQETPKNNAVVFEIGKIEYIINQESIVPISLLNSEEYKPSIFQLDISYDPATMKVSGIAAGNSLADSGKEMNWNRPDNKSIRIVVFDPNNKKAIKDGEVIKLKIMPITGVPDFKITQALAKNAEGLAVNTSISK